MSFKVSDVVFNKENGVGVVKAIDENSKMFRFLVRFSDGVGWFREEDLSVPDKKEIEKVRKKLARRASKRGGYATVPAVPMV